ncbi:hypothetical protein [Caulobacter mirabilis]|uniref:Uncharacterized protein n=1 Tax=Caulobacter mirabilis TaxID=69666 RepID=A0A2D2B2Z8_9CAUL|nr:hypothetical protein [Caulobacter mirabilis]ATQ44596.1 hypothetical protein CSW64_20475 [Caulobacter mirabilis]
MKTTTAIVLCALSLSAGAAVTAVAQTATRPAKAGECIVREQAEQIISTLAQRNEQLKTTTAALRDAEQRAVEAEAKAQEAAVAKQALQVAAERNRELVAIGKAILKDYEDMGLGKRTAAGEPLTQLYRVRLENKLQGFEDQIAAQRVFPERELEAARRPASPAAPAH